MQSEQFCKFHMELSLLISLQKKASPVEGFVGTVLAFNALRSAMCSGRLMLEKVRARLTPHTAVRNSVQTTTPSQQQQQPPLQPDSNSKFPAPATPAPVHTHAYRVMHHPCNWDQLIQLQHTINCKAHWAQPIGHHGQQA